MDTSEAMRLAGMYIILGGGWLDSSCVLLRRGHNSIVNSSEMHRLLLVVHVTLNILLSSP